MHSKPKPSPHYAIMAIEALQEQISTKQARIRVLESALRSVLVEQFGRLDHPAIDTSPFWLDVRNIMEDKHGVEPQTGHTT